MTATEHKFLIFELHGTRYALDLAQIAEIADPPPCWPIPLAPACLIGAMHIHGTIIAALDLALLLGQPHCHKPDKIIVLHRNIAAMAFPVDSVIRIAPKHEVMSSTSSGSCFTSCVLLLPEGETELLDLDQIVKTIENMMV